MTRLSEQLEFAQDSIKSDDDLRAFRHDIKNHFIVLNYMFSKAEYEKASNYVTSLCADFNTIYNKYSTGNPVTDSLLTVKSKEIPIYFDGMIPENFILPEDLCVIVGNLLDNAITACKNLKEQNDVIVNITSYVKNNRLIITVTNPIESKDNSKKVYHKLETTKIDKKNHGYGLININRSIHNNNGSLELYSENGIFTALVILEKGAIK